MDSKSLVKSVEMPAVGALYPKQFAERGYWWWKAQETYYALRPKSETMEIFNKSRSDIQDAHVAVLQIRRTDKTAGCATTYGDIHSFYVMNI